MPGLSPPDCTARMAPEISLLDLRSSNFRSSPISCLLRWRQELANYLCQDLGMRIVSVVPAFIQLHPSDVSQPLEQGRLADRGNKWIAITTDHEHWLVDLWQDGT